MPNEIILDATEYAEMVGAWEDGGVYRVELTITQTKNDGKTFRATVNEVTDYGDVEPEEEEEMPKKMPMHKKMPDAKEAKAAY